MCISSNALKINEVWNVPPNLRAFLITDTKLLSIFHVSREKHLVVTAQPL